MLHDPRGQLACILVVMNLIACSGHDLAEGAKSYVKGFYGGVAGDEPYSVLGARKILSAGGSAADAATAMYFSLAVTLPSAASLGGGGSCMVYRPKDKQASQKIEVLEFFSGKPSSISSTATRPSAVPGNPIGIFALHTRYGRKPWREMVAVGERLARFGFKMTRALWSKLNPIEGALLQDPASSIVFRGANGGSLKEGQVLRQLDLANTLSNIRANGPVDFYRGKFAQLLVDRVNATGGSLSLDDLRTYRPRWVDTISMEYKNKIFSRNKAHFVPPPAAAGVLQAQILGMLAHEGNFGGSSPQGKYHLLAETALIGYAERGRWMQEDYSSKFPLKNLVSSSVLGRLASKYNDARHISPNSFQHKPSLISEHPSATSFVIVDNSGMAVSCVFSMNNSFGIGRIAPDTGIMIAAIPEGIGRGPLSLSPMMIVNQYSNQLVLAASASGGAMAATALASVVARSYLDKISLGVALASPRIHHRGIPDITHYEPNLSTDVLSYLVDRGHKVAVTPSIGLVNIAFCAGGLPRDPDTCTILSDPRGHGLAISALIDLED